MKAFAVTAVFFFLLAIGFGIPAEGSSDRLFVQNVEGGKMIPAGDGEWRFEFTGVAPRTLFFQAGGGRHVQALATEEFVKDLAGKLEDEGAPRAALDIFGDDKDAVYVLEIRKAAYDAGEQKLIYRARILQQESAKPGRLKHRPVYAAAAERNFGRGAVFLDRVNL